MLLLLPTVVVAVVVVTVDNHGPFPGREIDLRDRNQFPRIRVTDESSGKTGISGQSGGRVDDDQNGDDERDAARGKEAQHVRPVDHKRHVTAV